MTCERDAATIAALRAQVEALERERDNLKASVSQCVEEDSQTRQRLNGEIEALRAQVSTAESDRDELIAEAYGVRDGVTEHTTIEAILEIRRVRERGEAMRDVAEAARAILTRHLHCVPVVTHAEMRTVALEWHAVIDALARLDASGKGGTE